MFGKFCVTLHRQQLTPCEAELTLSGYRTIRRPGSKYWLGYMLQKTNHIFVGGLPQIYPFSQVRFNRLLSKIKEQINVEIKYYVLLRRLNLSTIIVAA